MLRYALTSCVFRVGQLKNLRQQSKSTWRRISQRPNVKRYQNFCVLNCDLELTTLRTGKAKSDPCNSPACKIRLHAIRLHAIRLHAIRLHAIRPFLLVLNCNFMHGGYLFQASVKRGQSQCRLHKKRHSPQTHQARLTSTNARHRVVGRLCRCRHHWTELACFQHSTTQNLHQPLQRGKLDRFEPFSQHGSLLLDSCFRLFDFELLNVCFLSYAALFKVQV